jgi:hypothetical protein
MAFRSIFTAATTRRNFIPLSITRIRPLVPAATIRALACYRTSAKKSVDAENEEVKQILDVSLVDILFLANIPTDSR